MRALKRTPHGQDAIGRDEKAFLYSLLPARLIKDENLDHRAADVLKILQAKDIFRIHVEHCETPA